MYYSYVEIEYVVTSFSPTRTDLALKLLSLNEARENLWRIYAPVAVFLLNSLSAKSVLAGEKLVATYSIST
jgi:hypothetical protein